MSCGPDTVIIQWFLRDTPLISGSIVNIVTGNTSVNGNDTVQSTLTTEGTISTSHAGIYQCRANLTSDTTVVMSNTVTLNVKSEYLT